MEDTYDEINFLQTRFYRGQTPRSEKKKNKRGRPTGNCDEQKEAAFKKLVENLNNDTESDGQYTASKMMSLYKSFLYDADAEHCYKTLVNKLKNCYGGDLVITTQQGQETVFTMLDTSNHILREHCKNNSLTNERIIDMAATIINDEIRSTLYDLTKYPKFSNMGNDALTPKSLKRLQDGIVKTKAKVKPQTVERKKIAIAHSVISATRPRSFVSPILLGISCYLNTRLESRECIDILSSLAFCDNYIEHL